MTGASRSWYAQDESWGLEPWETTWDRRTYIEGVFGNLHYPNTENIHRGYVQIVGLPMVTLAISAAVVRAEQLARTDRQGDPTHPLLRSTIWVHGFTMFTKPTRSTPTLRVARSTRRPD